LVDLFSEHWLIFSLDFQLHLVSPITALYKKIQPDFCSKLLEQGAFFLKGINLRKKWL